MPLEVFEPKPGSPIAVLVSDIDNVQTSFEVSDIDFFPDPPCIATIFTEANFETIKYEGKDSGNRLLTTVTRGFRGTAQSWDSGTSIARVITSYDIESLQENSKAETIEDIVSNLLQDGSNISLSYDDENDKLTINASLEAAYPIGSIYINVNSTNPATLLGFGTWERFGKGKVLVSQDGADTDFDTGEETGGEKTHTLSVDEMPSHTHDFEYRAQSLDDGTNHNIMADDLGGSFKTTSSTGGDSPHNNLQPYIVVYMWKRTA